MAFDVAGEAGLENTQLLLWLFWSKTSYIVHVGIRRPV
jgi:hypothetical protein